jgi:hypothetical protein
MVQNFDSALQGDIPEQNALDENLDSKNDILYQLVLSWFHSLINKIIFTKKATP